MIGRVKQQIDRPSDGPTEGPTNWLYNWPTNSLTNQLNDQGSNQTTNQPTDWLIDWPTNQWTLWLGDSLTDTHDCYYSFKVYFIIFTKMILNESLCEKCPNAEFYLVRIFLYSCIFSVFSSCNQTMKFGQLLEYNKRNIFLQKLCGK